MDDDIRIAPLVVPAGLDAPDAGRFVEFVRIFNVMCRSDAGHADLDQDPLEQLGAWQATDDWMHLGFVAERGGTMVGAGTLFFATQPGTRTADYDVILEPALWGGGLEDALLDRLEAEARARGFDSLQTWTLHRPGGGGRRLSPPNGAGSIPADDRQTRFPLRRGFTLEQVERNSAFDLHGSFDTVERMLAEALIVAGDDYRVVQWTGATPPRYLESYGYTLSRMSTDTPQGGMDIEEEHWDAERVRRRDARQAAQGLTVSVTAVEHVPTGTIAAYNELVIAEDPAGATQQYGTLVLAEHRGRRLGAVVKCANLIRWRDIAPLSPRVSTFNAEENRHMLAINEALGFEPVSYAGAWKKVLAR